MLHTTAFCMLCCFMNWQLSLLNFKELEMHPEHQNIIMVSSSHKVSFLIYRDPSLFMGGGGGVRVAPKRNVFLGKKILLLIQPLKSHKNFYPTSNIN